MTAKPRASCRLETIELRQSCPGGHGNITHAASNIQTGFQECKGEHPLILKRSDRGNDSHSCLGCFVAMLGHKGLFMSVFAWLKHFNEANDSQSGRCCSQQQFHRNLTRYISLFFTVKKSRTIGTNINSHLRFMAWTIHSESLYFISWCNANIPTYWSSKIFIIHWQPPQNVFMRKPNVIEF